ncbi:MAG: glycosyltransferase family 4 protein [Planctomycetota bacterium]
MKRVRVLSSDPAGPSVRHRWARLAPHLQEARLELELDALPAEATQRAHVYEKARAADLVVLQRRLLRAPDFGRLRRASKRLVYDYDDAMCYRDPFRGRPASTARAQRFLQACTAADAVVAGSEILADLARPAEPRAVFVAPTPVDPTAYGPVPAERDDGKFRAGWIGSTATLPYLEALGDVLKKASAAIEGFRLVVIADGAPDLGDVEVEAVPWSDAGEADALRSLDVGLMPLSDDPWSRGKCGFKLLQYAATGLPLLASPVGVNSQIVEEGRNGFTASSDDAWVEALVRLAGDADLRRRLGAAARRDAEQRWSTDVLGPPLAAFLARVAEGD